jgi:Tfp pilus assembly protein PilZ
MKFTRKQGTETINISNVTKELIGAIMKMTGDEKYVLLRKTAGHQQSFSTFYNPKTITKQAIEMITNLSLDEKCKLLGELKATKGLSRRQFTRQDYVTPVHMVVKGALISAYTKNISKGGVFIDTPRAYELKFAPGDAITMNFDHPQLRRPIKITGKIVRVTKAGIGVSFDEYL